MPKPAAGVDWRLRAGLATLVLVAWSNSFALGFAADGKPSVVRHRCDALSELKDILADAREPAKAAYFAEAYRNLGCPLASAQHQ